MSCRQILSWLRNFSRNLPTRSETPPRNICSISLLLFSYRLLSFLLLLLSWLLSPQTLQENYMRVFNTQKHFCVLTVIKSTHLQGSTLITSTVYTISYGAVLDRDIISRSSYSPFAWITLFHNPVFSYKKVSLERWLTTQGETAQTWSLQTASKGEAEHDRQCVVQPTYKPTTSTETYSRTSRMNSYCFWLVFGRCRVEILGGVP